MRPLLLTQAENRHLLDAAALARFLSDETTRELVFDFGRRDGSSISTDLIREAIASLGKNATDSRELDDRLRALTLSVEELRAALEAGGFGAVEAWDSLTWIMAADLSELARDIFDTDAELVVRGLQDWADRPGLLRYLRDRARLGALRVLTDGRPASGPDQARIRQFLDTVATPTRGEALVLLARHATPEDTGVLLDGLSAVWGDDEVTVANAVASSADTERLLTYLTFDNRAVVIASAKELAKRDNVDEKLTDLLYSADSEVRVIALRGLLARWPVDRLRELSDTYPTGQSGKYFYNVVAALDWFLYRSTRLNPTIVGNDDEAIGGSE
jgi:hypothetical protein